MSNIHLHFHYHSAGAAAANTPAATSPPAAPVPVHGDSSPGEPGTVSTGIEQLLYHLMTASMAGGGNASGSMGSDHGPGVITFDVQSGTLPPRSPVGPSLREINRNTTLFTMENNSGAECAICQQIIGEEETSCVVRKINKCQHLFHSDCLDQWLESSGSCPNCRGSIVQD